MEPQNVDLPMLLRVHALGPRECSDPYRTLAGVIEIKARAFAQSTNIDQKLRFKRPAHAFATKTAMRIRRTRFWKGSGASWVRLGHLLAALGRLLAALGRLLAASWPSLGRSWVPSGCSWVSWVHFGSQGGPGPRFLRVCGGAGLGFTYIMHELLQEAHVGIDLGFSFTLAARRYMRSIWNWSQVNNLGPKKLIAGAPSGPRF